MTDKLPSNGVITNPWRRLSEFTAARIGLGRAGISLPTDRLLEFQLAHARAQDAVHLPLDVEALCRDLTGLTNDAPPHVVHSRAADRMTYLQRPDWGRRLDEASRERLSHNEDIPQAPFDLAIVIVDGLSSLAVQQNAEPFLRALIDALDDDSQYDWRLAPLTIVEQGRVAIGDEIGELLNARAVLVMVGERPGLSSPDSLGLYLTWAPKVGLTDAYRNCISNVRPAGLAYPDASRRLLYLLRESRQKQLSGVHLKDRTEDETIDHQGGSIRNFLIS
ncbi:ethanolamine ammonia-lyase subunit EutC [Halomonas sp. McH1-25]|uniref:ethanolamine ammonia-lyase subunit EutC n=1 Tax=unclassified Halomonas TaxID=2609666 RepID=UPI001EF5D83C|nr:MULTISPECIES: ethanolamine ammonia-lyase subunit EutC [unclassified Halomonas]MCG7600751.1 ethanolamine ammonia-lyase subunit EutC [Halomonas sp. McH1-25]MCP1341329.1 ethanolamine ammonia-lyase subunit EutC [Halomonas sp. FL8]MCP1361021.1 ethanolamine ammonia-lyase subunit EutC [Halomonas sp. BBD45]MCP1366210.1 ethanolamine ammonia-lyase subunit EutC [Halomonas sp. BBD48]